MARIPRLADTQRMQQQGLPDGSINPATPQGTFGIDTAPAAQQLSDLAMQAHDRANTARVMEADSSLTDFENRLLYDPTNGALNLRGRHAFGLPDQVMSEYDKQVQQIQEGLSPRQREAFGKLAAQRRDSIGRTVQRHVHGEISTYEQQQTASLIAGSQVAAANHYNDPERIGMELRRQRGALLARAQSQGWSPEQTQLEIHKAESATHGAVIDRLAANDPQAAIRYYAQHGPQMTPDDQMTYEKVVRQTRQRDAAERIVAGIAGNGSLGTDGVWERMVQQESGGRQFDRNGQPLTSSAGAVGIAQVMPDTGPEAARMAGLPWDEDRYRNDSEYNLALGRAYFDAQVDRYGDPMLAAAAYNAGPGNVDAWLREIGDPRDGSISREEWAQRIPFAETQGYVMTVAPPGQSAPGQEPLSRSQQMALLQRLPTEVRDIAQDRLDELWAIEDRQATELYQATQLEVENGTRFRDLPAQAVERLTADQIKALKARSKELATGEATMDWARWTEISMMSREQLAAIEDPYAELRPHLDDSHYNKALGLINDAKGTGGDLNTSSTLTFNQRVTNAAQLSGIVPANHTPARYTQAESELFSRFQNEVASRVEQAELRMGRKMTGNEQQEVIDEVLMDRARESAFIGSRETYLWSVDEDDQGKLFIPREEIPDDEYQAIENLILSNGQVPTRKSIERAYAQYRLDNHEAFEQIIRGEQ